MTRTIRLHVNGQPYEGTVEPRTSLVDFLRDGLDLTGTHVGCEHGVCGACTVLLDGEIREAISGNLCRCTGYHFIVEAIRAAARGM
jgi:carbon-monoxide dehydrogenase small subunit